MKNEINYDNSNRKRSGENYYYYFTSHEYAISNIKNNRIKISSYTSANDIHELLSINFSGNDIEAIIAQKHYRTNMGFISFSKYWDNPLMWGHYSDNNQGLCLGFIINYPMDDTDYRLKKIQPNELDHYTPTNKETSIRNIRCMVNTKSTDWIYEQESRLFEDLKVRDVETGLYFKELDEKIELKEIIVGPKSQYNPQDVRCFLDKIRFAGCVKIFKVKPSNELYLLEKDENFKEEVYSSVNENI
ncbi:MAG: DUF2971 domain-containing protein [Bacteroidales bacterium]|nr:DUF2971 domain-containing protein [Bacteroidales bacterium]